MALDMSKMRKMKMPSREEDKKKPMPAASSKDMDLIDMQDDDEEQDPRMEHMEDGSVDMEEGSPEEEASETPAEESMELEHVSDDDLVAEMKKRGLMKQMEQEDDSEADAVPYMK